VVSAVNVASCIGLIVVGVKDVFTPHVNGGEPAP